MYFAHEGEKDPQKFGAGFLRGKANERTVRFPSPLTVYHQHRADQLVAEWAKCSTIEAARLAEENLELFNEYLFLQSALEESRPIYEKLREIKAKNQGQLNANANGGMGVPEFSS